MSMEKIAAPIHKAMLFGILFAALNLFNAFLFYSAAWMSSMGLDERLHLFELIWTSSLLIFLVGAEMLRNLGDAGGNPLVLALVGVLNVVFIGMQLAVFADIVVPGITDIPVTLVVIYFVLASIGTIVVIGWIIRTWINSRRSS